MRHTMRSELGERACRALVLENSGAPRRRVWWIVSGDVLASCAKVA